MVRSKSMFSLCKSFLKYFSGSWNIFLSFMILLEWREGSWISWSSVVSQIALRVGVEIKLSLDKITDRTKAGGLEKSKPDLTSALWNLFVELKEWEFSFTSSPSPSTSSISGRRRITITSRSKEFPLWNRYPCWGRTSVFSLRSSRLFNRWWNSTGSTKMKSE